MTAPSKYTIRSFQDDMLARQLADLDSSVWNQETSDQLTAIAAHIRSCSYMNHNAAIVIDAILDRRAANA